MDCESRAWASSPPHPMLQLWKKGISQFLSNFLRILSVLPTHAMTRSREYLYGILPELPIGHLKGLSCQVQPFGTLPRPFTLCSPPVALHMNPSVYSLPRTLP